MIVSNGKEKRVWIEKITSGNGMHVMSSDIVEPTKEDIEIFKSQKCDHDVCTKQLIYDEYDGFMYDHRYCAICGISLGLV